MIIMMESGPIELNAPNGQDLMILGLPDELLLDIFYYLDSETLQQIGWTCKTFYRLWTNEYFWKRLLQRDFPHLEEKGNWHSLNYKKEYLRRTKNYPWCQRSISRFQHIRTLGHGTFVSKYVCLDLDKDEVVVAQKLSLAGEKLGSIYDLRECQILSKIKHPNILQLKEVVLTEIVNHFYSIYEYIDSERTALEYMPFMEKIHIQSVCRQLLEALNWLHQNQIVHRDLKPSNVLIDSKGRVKLKEFSMAGLASEPINDSYVGTLWYRAPEVIFEDISSSFSLDVWGFGCFLAELLLKLPLFPAFNQVRLLDYILSVCGTPTEEDRKRFKKSGTLISLLRHHDQTDSFKNCDTEFVQILTSIFQWIPEKRPTCQQILSYPVFRYCQFPVPISFNK